MVVGAPGSRLDGRVVFGVRALACPLTVRRAKETVHALAPGAVVSVLCAVPWTALDVEAWAVLGRTPAPAPRIPAG